MKAPLEWKLLRRELRADRGLFVFAAVAVAVAACALALVLSLAAAFDSALASDARVLLGGDFRVSLRERDFSEAEQKWLRDNAAAVSFARETQAMALADGRAQLTRLKSVDENYPLVGEIALGGGARFDPRDLGEENGVFNAMVEPSLGDMLGLAIGDSFRAAGLTLRVAAFIESEPDPADTRPILSAPLVLISQRAIERGRILVPGAIVRRDAKTLAPDAGAAFADKLRARFADGGFRVSTPEQALSRMRRQIDRVRVFFNLAALAAAIVAGVGVGGAVGIFCAVGKKTSPSSKWSAPNRRGWRGCIWRRLCSSRAAARWRDLSRDARLRLSFCRWRSPVCRFRRPLFGRANRFCARSRFRFSSPPLFRFCRPAVTPRSIRSFFLRKAPAAISTPLAGAKPRFSNGCFSPFRWRWRFGYRRWRRRRRIIFCSSRWRRRFFTARRLRFRIWRRRPRRSAGLRRGWVCACSRAGGGIWRRARFLWGFA